MTRSPANTQIDLNGAKLHTWYRDPRHIAARKEQVRLHPTCFRCGRPASLVLHEYPDDYQHGFEHYVSLIEKGERPTGCPACNRAERSGKRPCPSCVKKYHEGKQDMIHYIPQNREICAYCEDPDFVEKSRARKEKRNRQKNAHDRSQYRKYHPHKVIRNGRWVIGK